MFCPNCSKELPDGTKFCGGCGTPIAVNQTPVAPVEPEAPVYEAPAYEAPEVSTYEAPVAAPIKPAQKKSVDVGGILRGNELKAPAGIPPAETDHMARRTVAYTDLDVNGHLNNARYLDWVDDLSGSDFHGSHRLREMTLVYAQEAREGQELDLHWDFLEEGCMQVDAHRLSGTKDERVFSARIQFD